MPESLFFWRLTPKKEAMTQVFSCEFCKVFKNTFLYKTPPVTASGLSKECQGFRYISRNFPVTFLMTMLSLNYLTGEYCAKKWSFPLRISSVYVTKCVDSCKFGHIYLKNP